MKSSNKFQEKMNPRLVFAISGSLYLSVLLVSYLLALFYPFLTPYCWFLIPAVANFLVGYLTEEVKTALKIIVVSFFIHTGIVIALLSVPLIYDAFISWFNQVLQTSPVIRYAMGKNYPFGWMVIIVPGYPIMHILLGIAISFVATTVRDYIKP